MRSLAARQDLAREYREVTTGVAERETKRLEREREEKGSKHAHLAEEARAGLQAKEDFSSVQLRSGAVSLPHRQGEDADPSEGPQVLPEPPGPAPARVPQLRRLLRPSHSLTGLLLAGPLL